jgi:hypothetical protein
LQEEGVHWLQDYWKQRVNECVCTTAAYTVQYCTAARQIPDCNLSQLYW